MRCLSLWNCRTALGLEVGICLVEFDLLGERRALHLHVRGFTGSGFFEAINGTFTAQRVDLIGQRDAGWMIFGAVMAIFSVSGVTDAVDSMLPFWAQPPAAAVSAKSVRVPMLRAFMCRPPRAKNVE